MNSKLLVAHGVSFELLAAKTVLLDAELVPARPGKVVLVDAGLDLVYVKSLPRVVEAGQLQ